jgi:hypothetical protein
MRWFYFVKSKKRVAIWASHYASARDADQAFCDCVRLFYPVPSILYDRGFPFYSYYAYLAKTKQEEAPEPEPTPHVRVQL